MAYSAPYYLLIQIYFLDQIVASENGDICAKNGTTDPPFACENFLEKAVTLSKLLYQTC